jgi:undecaprenyl-diphosphatase
LEGDEYLETLKDKKNTPVNYWLLIAASIILLALTAVLLVLIRQAGANPLPLELKISQGLQELPDTWLPYLMALISLWGYMPWSALVVAASAWGLARWVNRWTGLYFLTIAVAQGVINTALKNIIARPRPIEPLARVMLPNSGYSFPSGHVMFYTTCFGLLIYLLLLERNRSILRNISLIILAALIVLVGPSRLYLGAHWLADVIAGYLLGALLLAWAIVVYESPGLKIRPGLES